MSSWLNRRASNLCANRSAICSSLLPCSACLLSQPWADRPGCASSNFAILYVFLALGLNIVVGFAGLLDLGYIAFYAVGAYVYALLASPHFGLHLPFWVILPLGANCRLHLWRTAGGADAQVAWGLSGHRYPRFRRNRAHLHEQPERADQYHQRSAGHHA
jgi:hypothetical protein